MAILKGKAAEKFLASNPKAAYDVMGTKGQVTQRSKGDSGIVGNLLEGVISPFTDFATGLGEQVNELGYRSKGGTSYTPEFLATDEWDEYVKNPLGKNVQNLAGVSSFLIPGGGITRSAISGGLYSASQADMRDPNKFLEDTAKGTLLAGGTAGALNLAGKGLEKFSNRTKTGEPGFLGRLADKQEVGAFNRRFTKAKDQGVIRDFQKNGYIKAKDVDELVSMADNTITTNGEKVMPAIQELDNTGITVTFNDIGDELQDMFTDKMALDSQKSVVANVIKDIRGVFKQNNGKLTPSQLYSLKQGVGNIKAKFASSIQDQSTADLYRKVYVKMNDKIDELLKSNGFDDFVELNKQTHTAFDALELAAKTDAKSMAARPINLLDAVTMAGGGVGGLPGMAVGAGVSKIVQSKAAEDAVVKGLRGADKVIQGANIPGASKLKTILSNPALKNAAPKAAAIAGTPRQSNADLVTPTDMDMLFENLESSVGEPKSRAAQIKEMRDQGMNSDSIKTMLEFLGEDDKAGTYKPTEIDKKFALAAKEAGHALALLEAGEASTGKVSNVASGIEQFLGTQSTGNTDYRSKVSLARTLARNAMLGASMTESEMNSLSQYIPEFTDEPEIAKQKLRSFISAMSNFAPNGG